MALGTFAYPLYITDSIIENLSLNIGHRIAAKVSGPHLGYPSCAICVIQAACDQSGSIYSLERLLLSTDSMRTKLYSRSFNFFHSNKQNR